MLRAVFQTLHVMQHLKVNFRKLSATFQTLHVTSKAACISQSYVQLSKVVHNFSKVTFKSCAHVGRNFRKLFFWGKKIFIVSKLKIDKKIQTIAIYNIYNYIQKKKNKTMHNITRSDLSMMLEK